MTSRRRFALASFLLAVAAGLFVAFAPLGQRCSVSGTPGQPSGRERCISESVFQHDGAWVLFLVSVPIVLTLVPVLVRHRAAAIVSAVLLWACCIVGIASLGLFFVPSAVLMTIAAARPDPERGSMDRRVTSEA
jgi:hypothetical protein